MKELKAKFYPTIQMAVFLRLFLAYLIVPLLIRAMPLIYRLAGFSYIRADNFAQIASHPLVIFFSLLAFLIYGFWIQFELGSLLLLCQRRVKARELWRQNLQLIHRQKVSFLLSSFLILPFLAHFFLGVFKLRLILPNFFLDGIFGQSKYRLIFFTSIILLNLCSLFFAFVLHELVLKKRKLKKAITRSIIFTWQNFWQIGLRVIIVKLAITIVFFLATVLGLGIVLLLLHIFAERSTIYLLLISISTAFKDLGSFLQGAISSASLMLVLTDFYLKKGEVESKQLKNKSSHSKGGRRRLNQLLILVFIVLVIISSLKVFLALRTDVEREIISDIKQTQITAHRGASLDYPENSLAAIRGAMSDFADYVELDIRLTSDQQLIVFHDSNYKRLLGLDAKVKDTSYQEIKDLPLYFQGKASKERVPLLKDVLSLAKGKLRLNLELKPDAGAEKELATAVYAEIKAAQMLDKLVISSLNKDSLDFIKSLDKKVKTMYILAFAAGNFDLDLNVDAFALEDSLLNLELVDRLQRQGKEVHVWTVNEEDRIKQLASYPVDNIITDLPLRAKEAVMSRSYNFVHVFSNWIRGYLE